MIFAFWAVLIAAVLPLACSYVAKFGAKGGGKRGDTGVDAATGSTPFDNRDPRGWLARQTGRRARADAAQANSWEALPIFGLGVVIAVLQHVPIATINLIAVIFVVARIVYIAVYIADMPMVRSLVLVIGFAASLALYFVAAGGSLH